MDQAMHAPHPQDALDDVGDGRVRVRAAAARPDGAGPRGAQRRALLAQPGVPQQRARARPPLRVLPEALQQEALHVLAEVVWKRWVLVLHTPHLLLGLSKFCKCMPGGGTTATYIAATGLGMCDLQLSARSYEG